MATLSHVPLPDDRAIESVSPAPSTSPTALPEPLSSLVGRDAEIASVTALLDAGETRVLTLTGPGGVGKTRLAIEVARVLEGDFADGSRLVPLASLRDPDLVLPALARIVGVQPRGDRPLVDILVDRLRDDHMLIVLDNFEHLLAKAPAWLVHLLAHCRRLCVLVTSRHPLNISGERRYQVSPLALPDDEPSPVEEAAAVRLFVQRARAIRPDFAITEANRAHVAEICRGLDGLPLAIELAAARVNALSPAQIMARMSSRFSVLYGGPGDVSTRQQSMHETIAWSYDLLSPDEQRLFQQLSVFVGGFTLESAEAVAQPRTTVTAVEVASLVDKSLLRLVHVHDDQPRFVMLETIRQYGLEQLVASGHEDDVRDRHASWCIGLSGAADPFDPSGQWAWLNGLDADHGNLHAALQWLDLHDRIDALADLAARLRWYWYATGRDAEGLEWYRRVLGRHGERSPSDRLDVWLFAGHFAQKLGRAEATRYLSNALALAREGGARLREAEATRYLGLIAKDRGDYGGAEDRLRTAGELYRQVGIPWFVTAVDYHLGVVMHGKGRLADATSALERARSLAAKAGDRLVSGLCCNYLALIACESGDLPLAAALLRHESSAFVQVAGMGDLPGLIATRAVFASATGHPTAAARLFGASARGDCPWMLPEKAAFERAEADVRRHLGDAAFAAAWNAGGRMRPREVTAEIDRLLAGDAEPASPVPSQPQAVDRLTRRELEVLCLMAHGLTNQQIADRLFNSKNTISNHVSHILDKLHVESRTAAVSIAIRERLV